MRNIGILTFHRSINYGAFMQSFALSNEIKKQIPNVNVEIIDFEYLSKHKLYKQSVYRSPFFLENTIKYLAFQRDLNTLPLSSESLITNNEDEVCDYIKKKYDVVIVGSDAVWAFQKMKLDNPYWLFGDKLIDVVKMSFAASAYSTDFRNVSNAEKDFIKDKLNSFDYIGVRDSETYNFIHQVIPEKEIHLNNDPTFFLNKANNQKLARRTLQKNLVFDDKPLVTFMTRGLPYIEEVKKHFGNKYRFIHFNHRNRAKDILNKKTTLLYNLSPIEWYNIYCQSEINFSQYFHGTLLGIRNNVPTFSFDDTSFDYPYIGKNENVMVDLSLNDYLFKTSELQKNLDEKERLFEQINFALNNIDQERLRLEKAANQERKKAESFFKALKSYL